VVSVERLRAVLEKLPRPDRAFARDVDEARGATYGPGDWFAVIGRTSQGEVAFGPYPAEEVEEARDLIASYLKGEWTIIRLSPPFEPPDWSATA
jgi:hypothetical protein